MAFVVVRGFPPVVREGLCSLFPRVYLLGDCFIVLFRILFSCFLIWFGMPSRCVCTFGTSTFVSLHSFALLLDRNFATIEPNSDQHQLYVLSAFDLTRLHVFGTRPQIFVMRGSSSNSGSCIFHAFLSAPVRVLGTSRTYDLHLRTHLGHRKGTCRAAVSPCLGFLSEFPS